MVVWFKTAGVQDRPTSLLSHRSDKRGSLELSTGISPFSFLELTTHHSRTHNSYPCRVSSANCARYSLSLTVRSGSAKARMATARRAALAAPSTATVATGMPVGI